MELPRVLLLIGVLCLNSALGQNRQCNGKQQCVEFEACPEFSMYDIFKTSSWPKLVQATVRSRLCKMEWRGSRKIYSICCDSAKTKPILNGPDCGKFSGERVAYGKSADVFQYPWMALLMDINKEFVCGGSLISENYVLTAAHCNKERRQIEYVRLGENNIANETDCNYFVNGMWEECSDPPQDIKVVEFIRHEKYSPGKRKNDIALIRLATRAKLSDSVKTICLPIGPKLKNLPLPPAMIVSGWGNTENGITSNVLQFAKLQHIETGRCERSIRRLSDVLTLDASQFCAQGKKLEDNCSGDSGGPMQYAAPGTGMVQHGIVSYGLATCGEVSSPGVYTRVSHYADWIMKKVV